MGFDSESITWISGCLLRTCHWVRLVSRLLNSSQFLSPEQPNSPTYKNRSGRTNALSIVAAGKLHHFKLSKPRIIYIYIYIYRFGHDLPSQRESAYALKHQLKTLHPTRRYDKKIFYYFFILYISEQKSSFQHIFPQHEINCSFGYYFILQPS